MYRTVCGSVLIAYVFCLWSETETANGDVWSFWEILTTPLCVFCDELGNLFRSVSPSYYRYRKIKIVHRYQ